MTQSSRDAPRDPPRRVAGMEYDFRRPTLTRLRARGWNPADRRVFTPKAFGWGFDVNFYWLVHPVQRLRLRRPPGAPG